MGLNPERHSLHYDRELYSSSVSTITPMAPTKTIPRVLFVDNQVSDFLQYRMPLADALQEAGFDVHAAVPPEVGWKDISCRGITVHTFYMRRKSTQPLDELRCFFSLFRLYRRLRPTLIHHICLKPALYGGIAARIVRVPAAVSTLTGLGHLFTTRNVKAGVLRWIVARCLRVSFAHRNNRVIFQNGDDRDRMVASRIVPSECAVLIKGSGVNLSSFAPKPAPEGAPMVLMASRLLWTKGVGEFVAAARSLRDCGIRARFVLIGEPDPGHPSAIPVHTLKRWRRAADVEWLGWRHDVPELIAQSHIVCLPSSYGEGIPRILMEAAACGRPAIATDCPGCREIVRHGQNGLLVPAGRVEALVDAVAQLIDNAPLRAAMGIRGREIAVAEFSLEKMIDANLAVYRSLLVSIPRTRRAAAIDL